MKQIYIAGKITNTSDYHAKFRAAEKMIFRMGGVPLNPVLLGEDLIESYALKGKEPIHADFMRMLMPFLAKSDAVFLLPDWYKSDGAKFEKMAAETMGITCLFTESDLENFIKK